MLLDYISCVLTLIRLSSVWTRRCRPSGRCIDVAYRQLLNKSKILLFNDELMRHPAHVLSRARNNLPLHPPGKQRRRAGSRTVRSCARVNKSICVTTTMTVAVQESFSWFMTGGWNLHGLVVTYPVATFFFQHTTSHSSTSEPSLTKREPRSRDVTSE